MVTTREPSAWSISGLRTRYKPRSRLGHGLVSVAPWVDMVLLLIMVAMLNARVLLQPGVVVDLPETPFSQGTRHGLVAVVLSAGTTGDGGREQIVFFDDERFLVSSEAQMRKLRVTLAAQAQERDAASLVIQVDKRVPHGTVVDIVDMAAEVGLHQVNVASRPE